MKDNSNGSLSLIAVGDIYICINVNQAYEKFGVPFVKREDPVSAFALVLPFLKQHDFILANEESPISDRGVPLQGRPLAFRSDPVAVKALVAAGFSAVGLANNHSSDHGVDALQQTIELLDKAKIGHAGAGRNLIEAHRAAIVERKGTRVALLSYSSVFRPGWEAGKDSPGISVVRVNTCYQPPARFFEMPGLPPQVITSPEKADLETMKLDIRDARAQADIVVMSWHWGRSEGFEDVMDYQVELAHAAIDSGADFVFGHHSHRPQGIEVYKGKAIFYSLGNFVIDSDRPAFAKEALIARCRIRDKHISGISMVPVRANQRKEPEVQDPAQGKDIIALVQKRSEKFGTRFSIEKNEVAIHTEG